MTKPKEKKPRHQQIKGTSQSSGRSEEQGQTAEEIKESDQRATKAVGKQNKAQPLGGIQRLRLWAVEWKELIPVVFSALIFFVTSIYTVVSIFQWQEAIRTREIENRAYFGIKNAFLKIPPASGREINPTVEFVNAGRTPALNIKIDIGIGLLPRTVPEKLPENVNHLPGRSVVLPGENLAQTILPPSLSDQDFSMRIKSGFLVYLWGTIEYDDFFGKHHTTEFCFFNDNMNNTNFVVCPSHNTFN
jgi:hypothetical protein